MSSDYSDVFYAQMKLVKKTLLLGLEREYKFHKTRKWRFDFAYPDIQLAVEIDGGQWRAGGGRHNSDKDKEKLNHAVLNGWHVLRFSTTQAKNDPMSCFDFIEECISAKKIANDYGEVLNSVKKKMIEGQLNYGQYNPKKCNRNMLDEACEELMDAINYCFFQITKLKNMNS